MIQPVRLNSHIQFKGLEQNQNTQAEEKTADNKQQQAQEQTVKASPKDAYKATRDVVIGTLKGFNNVANTSQGALRGVAEGAVGAVIVGALGKNIKNSKGNIAGTLKGIGKDTMKGAGKILKVIPSLLTKSPVQNLKNVAGAPAKFYSTYLKGNKLTAAIATTVGLGIASFRTIQGKMTANLNNANIDHKTNRGHIKD